MPKINFSYLKDIEWKMVLGLVILVVIMCAFPTYAIIQLFKSDPPIKIMLVDAGVPEASEWTGSSNEDHILRMILTSLSELGDMVYMAEGTGIITAVDLDKATMTVRLDQNDQELVGSQTRSFRIQVTELPRDVE